MAADQEIFESKAKEILGDKGTPDLNTLRNEELQILVAYETWKDGMDWELVADYRESIARWSRKNLLDTLKDTYGYDQG